MNAGHAFRIVLGVLLMAPCASAELWSTPMPVSAVNSPLNEGAPFLSYDGLSLYFSRSVPFDSGSQRLFVATRTTVSEPFGAASELTGLNPGGSAQNYPWVSTDHQRLYYYQGSRIMRSQWESGNSWSLGTSVAELNGLGVVVNPSLTPDELTIVFVGSDLAGGKGGYDIWMGTRPSTSMAFSGFQNVASVNTSLADLHPRLSADGLTLYFASNRTAGGVDYELFRATRPNSSSAFGTPEVLSFFDAPGYTIQYPDISADGQTLYFVKGLPAGTGYDIYVSHVVPAPGAIVLGLLGLSYAGWRCRRAKA